jgi:hypothetical protein
MGGNNLAALGEGKKNCLPAQLTKHHDMKTYGGVDLKVVGRLQSRSGRCAISAGNRTPSGP